jgi:peptidylprolyl isomerase
MKSFKAMIVFTALVSMSSISFAADSMVTKGMNIKMDYTLTVNNEQLESSVGKQPLEFVYGDESIIPGLEKAIEGMKVGEEKTAVIASKDAYGDPDPKAIKDFPRTNLPTTPEPKVGMVLQAQSPDGQSFPAVIAAINGDKVSLDFNHPLAGKELTFKIKILDISNPPAISSVSKTLEK